MVVKFIERFRAWRHRRFLGKHGCTTQREYDLKYDPDYNTRGRRLKREQYCGYPHVYIMSRVPDSFQAWDYHFLVDEMAKWCDAQCKDKWRHDWHRIIEDIWIDGEWEENGISGMDAMCFAFKDSKDYTMFLLRWS